MVNKNELKKAINLMAEKWCKQNNILDRKTSFVYDVINLRQLNDICKRVLKDREHRQYALHRWVNLQISEFCEEMFCKYGAEKVKNKKDKEKDIYIMGEGFDVKVTNYPVTAAEDFNLNSDEGKKDLITWFYNNQSKEGREHYKNRLFVVCCGKNIREMWNVRTNLEMLEQGIKYYMEDEFAPTYYLEEFDCSAGVVVIKL